MRQESGRSMVEIIGVIAIMALISAGAFILIRSGMASQRRSIIVDDVSKIVSGIRSLYSDYDDLATLDGDGAMVAMGVDTSGPDGVTYTVAPVKNSDNKYMLFKVTIGGGLSYQDCMVLGAKSWSGAVASTEDDENPFADCDVDNEENTIEIKYDK